MAGRTGAPTANAVSHAHRTCRAAAGGDISLYSRNYLFSKYWFGSLDGNPSQVRPTSGFGHNLSLRQWPQLRLHQLRCASGPTCGPISYAVPAAPSTDPFGAHRAGVRRD